MDANRRMESADESAAAAAGATERAHADAIECLERFAAAWPAFALSIEMVPDWQVRELRRCIQDYVGCLHRLGLTPEVVIASVKSLVNRTVQISDAVRPVTEVAVACAISAYYES